MEYKKSYHSNYAFRNVIKVEQNLNKNILSYFYVVDFVKFLDLAIHILNTLGKYLSNCLHMPCLIILFNTIGAIKTTTKN